MLRQLFLQLLTDR